MAIKILSVDDELDLEVLLTQYFRRKIRKGEYEFSFAHNGLEALEMISKKKDFDIILSDINMPEMDGLTLLTRINEMRNPALKCIMVSAYGDMDNIRSAMNNGAFDFSTKPIDLDDLSVTIEKAIAQIDYIKESQKEHQQLEQIQGDLQVAGEIQQAILPKKFEPQTDCINTLDIFASMTPAKDVGGDFFDYFQIDDDHIGLVIADVSGKGVPASLFMAVSRTLIRATALRGIPSSECITYVNKLLCNESVDCMFVTAFYGIYNTRTGEMDYTNAGHNPPYILHSDKRVEMLKVAYKNLVIGVMNDFVFKSGSMKLEIGDALIMYTDGVTEACNENKEMFSEANLEKTLSSVGDASSEAITNAIIKDVKGFAGNEPQSDDITLLTIKSLL